MTGDTARLSSPDWNTAWFAARERLRRELGDAVFDAWLAQLSLQSADSADLKLAAPRMFIRNWVASQYVARIERALRAEGAQPSSITSVLAPPTVGGGLTGEQVRPVATVSDIPVVAPRLPDPRPDSRKGLSRREVDPGQSFDSFVAGTANEFAHGAARAFANGETPDIPLLYIHGTFGLGKTHLLNAVALTAQARGRRAILLSSEEFMRRFLGAL